MTNLKTDRRSQRTQRAIHEALMALMQEKRYDDITVQDIIDRADVGRSTFYAHFQDKENLMVSGLMRLMQILSEMVAEPSATGEPRLLPTRELFEHVQEHQNLFRGMVRGRGLELFYEKGQEYWSQKLTADLQARLPKGQQPTVPLPVLAQFIAGTFVTMLRWWLDNKMPYSPQEMDEMMQRLIMPAVQNCMRDE
jgi:AcrR family transcriptional regulator